MSRDNNPVEQHVLEAIRSLKYGAVEIQVHDSRIVQVEKTEKTRFDISRQDKQ
ncbi:MAG: YezD family protein [Rickettsiales bacterium]|nr:YezD family protein [Rickettsiales bacterium]